jgi:hypothetical protein
MLSVAFAAIGAAPVVAQTSPADADLLEAYKELKASRAGAAEALRIADEALRKADEAIAKFERRHVLGAVPPPDLASAPQPLSSAAVASGLTRPSDMPACDAAGGSGSIGAYMLDMKSGPKQKKEASFDAEEDGTNRGINAFVYHCLKLTKASQYEAITNLSVQFTGTKGNDQAEMAVTRTARAVKSARTRKGEDGLASTYNRYRLGGFGRTGSNGDAPLIDLTESNFASGVGVLAGFEWGRSRATAIAELRTTIHSGIAKARQDCIAAHSVDDPLTNATFDARPHMALNPLSMCEGAGLAEWMSNSKRANQYWGDIVAPLWGVKMEPELFAGIEGRYAFQDISYLPVIDPATGAVIVTTLPDAVKIHPEPYSLKLYGGFNREVGQQDRRTATIGLTGSLTYRREVDFLGNSSGKTLCSPAAPGATFDICDTDLKLAAPYDTSGFVGGLAFNLQFRRFWQLPPIAMSPRLTYAFDTKRFGIEVPLFLLTDSDGKLNSGFKYTCRFRGTTPEGFELKKTCGVNLFVGTNFGIGTTP